MGSEMCIRDRIKGSVEPAAADFVPIKGLTAAPVPGDAGLTGPAISSVPVCAGMGALPKGDHPAPAGWVESDGIA